MPFNSMFDKFSSHHIGHGPDENAWKMNWVMVQALKNGENESVDLLSLICKII